MYIIRTIPGRTLSDGYYMAASHTLCEMSAAELREATADPQPDWAQGKTFKPCGADYARRWVADGGRHETALYRDHEGRIRYARDGF